MRALQGLRGLPRVGERGSVRAGDATGTPHRGAVPGQRRYCGPAGSTGPTGAVQRPPAPLRPCTPSRPFPSHPIPTHPIVVSCRVVSCRVCPVPSRPVSGVQSAICLGRANRAPPLRRSQWEQRPPRPGQWERGAQPPGQWARVILMRLIFIREMLALPGPSWGPGPGLRVRAGGAPGSPGAPRVPGPAGIALPGQDPGQPGLWGSAAPGPLVMGQPSHLRGSGL